MLNVLLGPFSPHLYNERGKGKYGMSNSVRQKTHVHIFFIPQYLLNCSQKKWHCLSCCQVKLPPLQTCCPLVLVVAVGDSFKNIIGFSDSTCNFHALLSRYFYSFVHEKQIDLQLPRLRSMTKATINMCTIPSPKPI